MSVFVFCCGLTNYTAKLLQKCLDIDPESRTYGDMGALGKWQWHVHIQQRIHTYCLVVTTTSLWFEGANLGHSFVYYRADHKQCSIGRLVGRRYRLAVSRILAQGDSRAVLLHPDAHAVSACAPSVLHQSAGHHQCLQHHYCHCCGRCDQEGCSGQFDRACSKSAMCFMLFHLLTKPFIV